MGASLDVLSNGRLTLGLGAGWHEPEFASFGYDISTPARVAKLRESLEIISRLWAGDDVTYDGKYYKVANASCYPKPKQKPHPPLLVAGDGPKLLQLAARYADVYTTSSYATSSPDQCRERFEELKTCCLKVGRDYDDIRKAYHFQVLLSRDDKELNKVIDAIKPGHLSSKEFIATHPEKLKPMKADQFVKFLKGFRDVGVDEFIVYMEGYAVHRESLMILKGLMEEIKAL
jgi:alkanesulfonate monooxygenase SsuD/methylene tetrahydromethanopterin reductase-like flavin-dependent oxidoreductase (luciferase family)